jgi:hypothetical protein
MENLFVLIEYRYNLFSHFLKNVLTIINSNFIYILFSNNNNIYEYTQ